MRTALSPRQPPLLGDPTRPPGSGFASACISAPPTSPAGDLRLTKMQVDASTSRMPHPEPPVYTTFEYFFLLFFVCFCILSWNGEGPCLV